MKKFYVDFSGYCIIEAETSEEAFNKFLNTTQPPCEDCDNVTYDIDGVEEKEDN